ncbi:hypothetical protein C8R47DRAFT_1069650 [Mycena vitilis]|nr:hypothetical protein C8R47DRAFT_1069650 [Mycena vitilis]
MQNWEEREKAIQLNTRLKTDAMMPHIQKLEAWEGQLSPEEKAIMEPTEEEEAHSEQRLAEIMQGDKALQKGQVDRRSGVRRRVGRHSPLREALVNRLYERASVDLALAHSTDLSGFQPVNALRTSQWDSLEKAMTVFILPPDAPGAGQRRIHRRLDLIFAAPEAYWTAITRWTGSTMFERDLRLWAKERGMKFDSAGMTRRRNSKQYFPRSEQEVFDILGLEWMEPALRNADA